MTFPHIWLAQNNITDIKRGNITHYLILEGMDATLIGVVSGDFVEVAPLPSVILHLSFTLLFLCLGLVVGRLLARTVFTILWLLRICRPKLPFVLVPKFLLNFKDISIGNSQ